MSAVAVEVRTDHESENGPMRPISRAHPGLTSRQAWTLEHIVRCPSCGSWTTVLDREITEGLMDGVAVCQHFGAHT